MIGLCVFIIVIVGGGKDIEATTNAPRYEYMLYGGVGEYGEKIRYWYFNNNDYYYMSCAQCAMNAWMDTNVNKMADYICFKKTTDKNRAAIIISLCADGMCGYNGYTSHVLNNSGVLPDYSPWDTAYVAYNTTNGYIDSRSSELIIGVFAHEIGHAFGLNENNNNKNSIMCQWQENRFVTVPTSNDIWSAIAIYVK